MFIAEKSANTKAKREKLPIIQITALFCMRICKCYMQMAQYSRVTCFFCNLIDMNTFPAHHISLHKSFLMQTEQAIPHGGYSVLWGPISCYYK